jgi:membrane-bound metal-dependent hydrolase YbcI (DUF457 family)
VDPVSHVAFGYTVVRAACPVVPRLTLAACLGALAPDADAVFMPAGWDVYLRVHELGTHTLVGAAPVALAVAFIARGRTGAPLLPLFQIALLAVMSHLTLDVISGARTLLGWPFLSERTSLPLVAMAEPWMIVLLVIGLVALWRFKDQARIIALGVVALVCVFLSVKAIWLLQARGTLDRETVAFKGAEIIEAKWLSLREWNVFGGTETRLMQVIIRPDRPPRIVASWPIGADFPLAVASRRLDTVRNFLAVHELAFARQLPAVDGMTEVLWSDVRFCWMPGADPPGATTRRLPAIGSSPERIACALWVGGVFDHEGRALSQRVRVFGLWQTRPAPP